jgi:hypothetical protein
LTQAFGTVWNLAMTQFLFTLLDLNRLEDADKIVTLPDEPCGLRVDETRVARRLFPRGWMCTPA